MAQYPPSTSPPLTVVTQECAAYLLSTSGETTACMVRQKGAGGPGAAFSAASDNPDTSAVLINGTEKSKGTVKIGHQGYRDGSDSWAAALSIDLRVKGTAAQGIFVTATDGPTRGNLLVLRNNNVDDLVVKATGRVGLGVGQGSSPAGALEVVQRDPAAPAVVITGHTRSGSLLEVRNAAGDPVCEINAAGRVSASSVTLVSDPSSKQGRGELFVDADGYLTFRGARGTVTKLAAP